MEGPLAIAALYIFKAAFGWWLSLLNLRSLQKSSGPALDGRLSAGLLEKSQAYLAENTRFAVLSSVVSTSLIIAFVFGLLVHYDRWVASFGLGFIASGIAFFLILSFAGELASIPFSLYRTFRIEKRHGFNAMTPGLWLTDLVKSLVLSTVLFSVVATGGLFVVKAFPGLWWLIGWAFFLVFSIFMMYISPYVIEPLFNKFEPVDDERFRKKIESLAERAGIRIKAIMKIDASRRTKHTNAYFTGFGSVKRIVLFDTLLKNLTPAEAASVLAHEIGHWKRRHLLKHLFLLEAGALAAFYISFRLINGDLLARLFGLGDPGFFAKLVCLSLLWAIAGFFVAPVLNAISRRHEREADAYAARLEGAEAMTSALVKLTEDNLSNPFPHPLYVFFNYSHPPVEERIRLLKGKRDV
ncbi:MAG: M48 family metallopeptidase [Deltaproteobacteria bacterium]|nr:M48 family metallopeptidase [Deltaproteobacteria bacterium]